MSLVPNGDKVDKDDKGNKARVFFALWPDVAAAARLHDIASRWHVGLGGRVMREDSLHATLVFIGDVATDRLATLLDLAGEIDAAAFGVAFDDAGCWRHNQIAYLGMRRMPDALRNLQFELATRVQVAGFRIEQRRYSPHVTLIRKADCSSEMREKENLGESLENKNPATEPVAWSVRDFVLVKSSINANGSRYEQIGRWPLLEDYLTP
ncbi:MAG: 2'-5' RNA ligase [Hydrogenophilales bacterium 28-61-23]|nr:MAG: 2'-5' RNA ligase [Hydrogenophilales bacterium 28-61-23]